MTIARRSQVDLSATPYYHCVNRCVRRAFLCGEDRVSGRNYDHRKGWIVNKLKELAGIFALDVCAYAVMSNHYHVVLRVDAERAERWPLKEVAERWNTLFHMPPLVARWQRDEVSTRAEVQKAEEVIESWRERLTDISWFMRCLNEAIARQANAEDGCKGRFWEGRFKSRALLDEAALLSCMMYVDLNPVRAGICRRLEDSDYTSIQERILAYATSRRGRRQTQENESPTEARTSGNLRSFPPGALLPFGERNTNCADNRHSVIPYGLKDYFALIDWTGRAIRKDKPGAIPEHIQPLLMKLGVEPEYWLVHVKHFEYRYPRVAGSVEAIRHCADRWKRRWLKGCGPARHMYVA